MKNQKIELAIFTSEPVPVGMAATNRILSYSMGLVSQGDHVVIYSTKPGFNDSYKNTNGEFQGVEYHIISNLSSWDINKFIKAYYFILAHFKFFNVLLKDKSKNKKPIVLVVSNKVFTIVFLRIITWILRLSLLQEKSEFPFYYLSNNWVKKRILAPIYSNTIYRLFDGMIVMTTALHSFFRKRTRKLTPIIIYPLTIDANRFHNAIPTKKFNFRYIAYTGYMGGNKDGLIDLIESFSIISEKIKDVNLLLVGDAGKEDLERLYEFVHQRGLDQRIIFTGRVDRDAIPSILTSAELLVLARPANLQAAGGFPTKLGEYLASGRPVVVTKVGEIPNYLKDEQQALLCEPGNCQDIADKMLNVIENPSRYAAMALAGQKLAFDVFDYKARSMQLHEFLSHFYYER